VTAVSGRSKPEVAVDRTPNIPTEGGHFTELVPPLNDVVWSNDKHTATTLKLQTKICFAAYTNNKL